MVTFSGIRRQGALLKKTIHPANKNTLLFE
jgi:hypothetical protein